MNNFLASVTLFLLLIVGLGFFNEKVTKLTGEIALMLFAVILGCIFLALGVIVKDVPAIQVLANMHQWNLEEFLLEGVLCFMLFSGSCHMRLRDFKTHARTISLLAIGATLLGAVFYGLLFYAVARLFGLPIDLPICLMFGSITAPTDPIAATSILKKFNLPKSIGFIMEGESLLNDGVGVALFVCFSSIVTAQKNGGFFSVMARELLGALLVGIIVTAICFPIFKSTKDADRKIFTSLLAVSAAYLICEYCGFSGAIASVVCGVLFSALRNRADMRGETLELEQFDVFWGILDNLLNSVLYIMLGLSFLQVMKMPNILILSCVAILINFAGRFGSVGLSSTLMGKLPDGYDKLSFAKLLTWGGLRGGLSVALAMSTQSMLPENIYYIILGGTYAIVFFTTIVQGLTMKKVYARIEKGQRS